MRRLNDLTFMCINNSKAYTVVSRNTLEHITYILHLMNHSIRTKCPQKLGRACFVNEHDRYISRFQKKARFSCFEIESLEAHIKGYVAEKADKGLTNCC